jgi:hypothetical protein
MPLKIELHVGDDSFLLEGELGGPIDEQVVNLAKAWVAALPPSDPDSEDAELAEQLRSVKADIAGHSTSLKGAYTPDEEPTPEPEPEPMQR